MRVYEAPDARRCKRRPSKESGLSSPCSQWRPHGELELPSSQLLLRRLNKLIQSLIHNAKLSRIQSESFIIPNSRRSQTERKRQSIDATIEMTEMTELSDNDFKAAMIKIFQ